MHRQASAAAAATATAIAAAAATVCRQNVFPFINPRPSPSARRSLFTPPRVPREN